jgi:hypothetical protein
VSDSQPTPAIVQHFKERPMVATVIAIALGALVLGAGGAGFGVHRVHVKAQEQAAAQVAAAVDTTAQGQATAVEQLTDLDLVEPLCSQEWLADDPEGWRRLLCREALCWAQAQSTTTAAETSTCGSISNLADSVTILELCGTPGTVEFTACLQVVNSRK